MSSGLHKEISSKEVTRDTASSFDKKSLTRTHTRADSDIASITVEDEKYNLAETPHDENGPNPFLNPKVAEFYNNLYNSTKYECRKAFDPHFNWEKTEEKKLVRILDFRVALLACFMFVALQVDRGNLSQATADNLLDDVGLTTNNYNTGNTIFFLCFLAAELPSQLVSKRLGCDVWIPIQMCAWSIVSLAQCRMASKSSFYATRALMGLLEGGFIPDLILWMSYFYTSAELTIRLSWFWTSLLFTQIFTALMAFGLFHMRGIKGWAGWQWLFLIEGLFTLLIGLSSFFLMFPSAVQTKRPWTKKAVFSERQEKIIVNRVLRDDPTKGDMHNRQGLTPKMLWAGICDYHLWPIYFIGILAYLPSKQLTSYLSLLLRQMGFSTFTTSVLGIPNNVIEMVLLLVMTWFSEKVKDIFLVALAAPFWQVPLLGVLRWWSGSLVNRWGTYAVLTLALGAPYIHAMCVSACSRNSRSIKTRTVSASLYNMFVQAGSIIGSNIYRKKDKPLYHTGNTVLFFLGLALIPVLLFTKWFYWHINKTRDRKWKAMTPEERDEYILTTTDRGSSRLDFRFAC